MIKLLNYYFTKNFRKNWVRILIFSLLVSVLWGFVIPIFSYKKILGDEFRKYGINSFGDFSKIYVENNESIIKELNGDENEQDLLERMDEEQDPKIKNEILGKILQLNSFEKGSFLNIIQIPFTKDICEFINGREITGKLLNDISFGSLTGFISLYFLIFPIFEKVFKNSEERNVISFTPSVKRNDIILGKFFSFIGLFLICQLVTFVIPFSVYYFGIGENFSILNYLSLIFYSTLIYPLLFSFLILIPYLLINELNWLLGSLFSILFSLFPILGLAAKYIFCGRGLGKIEQFFFTPHWFALISLVTGLICIIVYFQRYNEKDF